MRRRFMRRKFPRRKIKMGKKSNLKAVHIFLAIIIFFSIFIFYEIDRKLKPTIAAICDTEARNTANETINTTVKEEFGSRVSYDDMMDTKLDKDGNIVMIQANTVELNKIGSEISLTIQEKIKETGVKSTKIPLGAIMQNDLFASYGPKIGFKMKPIGSVTTSYRSEFEAQGINQTRHVIYVDVTTTIQVIIPFSSNKIEVTSNIPIAESIIVGKVPDTYANFGRELQNIGKSDYNVVKEQSE